MPRADAGPAVATEAAITADSPHRDFVAKAVTAIGIVWCESPSCTATERTTWTLRQLGNGNVCESGCSGNAVSPVSAMLRNIKSNGHPVDPAIRSHPGFETLNGWPGANHTCQSKIMDL